MQKKLSKFRVILHNKTLHKSIFYCIFCHNEKFTNDAEGANKKCNRSLNYRYDCSNPRTFNEYSNWIKFNYRNELWKKCADKLGSKEFLKEHGFDKYVVPTLKIYDSVDQINLDELPEHFVLKTNHDSGTVFICNKKTTNFEEVFKRLDKSMHTSYSSESSEWVYEDVVPKILAEKVLQPRVGNVLADYKLFAFNGKFGWGFTGQNREIDTRFIVFEDNFEIQNVEYIYLKPRKKDMPKKPQGFDEMVKVAEEISKILDFVRVDFYDTTEGIKIGELTFFSQSGHGRFTKKKYDFKYGKMFDRTELSKLVVRKK